MSDQLDELFDSKKYTDQYTKDFAAHTSSNMSHLDPAHAREVRQRLHYIKTLPLFNQKRIKQHERRIKKIVGHDKYKSFSTRPEHFA